MKPPAWIGISLFLPSLAWGQTASLAVRKRQLKEMHKQIENISQEVEHLRTQESSLTQALSGLKSDLGAYRSRLKRLQQDLVSAEQKKRDLEAQQAAVRFGLSEWRSSLEQEILQGERLLDAEIPFFGSADVWASECRESILRRQVAFLENLDTSRNLTENLVRRAARNSQEIKRMTVEVFEKHRTKERAYESQKDQLEALRAKRQQTAERLSELQRSAQELTALVGRLARKTPSRKGQRIALPLHSLPWPVPGRVVVRFGKGRVPGSEAWAVHDGIRLKASPGAEVRPVRTGKVLYAGRFRSYGQVVILEHAEGFFSIYGLLGAVSVQPGEWIRPQDVLGRLGGDGVLHFELRVDTVAVDPARYLKEVKGRDI